MKPDSMPAPLEITQNFNFQDIYDEIQDLYKKNESPWIIGYSGGKDSTAVLQLIWYALAGLSPEERSKTVHVLSSDTLVETPVIVDHINDTLDRINNAAQAQNLPFQAHKVKPKLENTFWVNLIGKGYPAPSSRFRWCTDRLKIQPANNFILQSVAKYGEVIVVLGIRSSESATRAQSMSLRKIEGSTLRRHSTLPNAFVYAPIEHFSTDDVWSYLLNVPSPWGNQNRDLLALYRSASSGECPLVIDTTTPSCGNSRFGCWVCTVVQKDKAMEALIDNGEEWMEPLLEIRDFLASTQVPEDKHKYRSHRRRGGQISFKSDGTVIRGPYYLDVSKDILRKLLEAQKQIADEVEDREVILVQEDELHEIRRIWITERQDWDDSLPAIYRNVFGHDLNWAVDDGPIFSSEDKTILASICERDGVPVDLVAKLLETEKQLHGMYRRAGIFDRLEQILNEDWRTEDELLTPQPNLL